MTKPDSSSPPPDDRGYNRRGFFRALLLRGVEQAEQAGRQVQQRIAGAIDSGAAAVNHTKPGAAPSANIANAVGRYLRPPGALPEADFAAACSRCGKCVQACPAQCIVLDAVPTTQSAGTPVPRAAGLPFIEARRSPCVVCDDLSCMKVCPTGALKLVESITHIHMGLALVDHNRCLRGLDGKGEPCTLCITPCPIGETAIGIDSYGRIQIRPGCIGCGLCERACPTEPASVWVVPNAVISGQ